MKKMRVVLLIALSSIGVFMINSCSKDDDCTPQTWYNDSDGDGFGNPNITQQSCMPPIDYVSDNTDFDDTNATAFPGADEICNDGIDNNGNGEIDECSVINDIAGNWTSNFGDSYTINSSSITSSGNVYTILLVGDNFVICQNGVDNTFDAGLFSKFVFTNISIDQFNFCQSFFNSPSQEFIENSTEPSDSNDLISGCGGFSWGEMIRD